MCFVNNQYSLFFFNFSCFILFTLLIFQFGPCLLTKIKFESWFRIVFNCSTDHWSSYINWGMRCCSRPLNCRHIYAQRWAGKGGNGSFGPEWRKTMEVAARGELLGGHEIMRSRYGQHRWSTWWFYHCRTLPQAGFTFFNCIQSQKIGV